jgi:lipocalin
MFILRKIQNAGVNVAEGCKMPASNDTAYMRGSALCLKSGKVANCASTTKVEYIALENASGKDFIHCIKVDSNMIFEAKSTADTTNIKIGDKLGLSVVEGCAINVGAANENGAATVVEKSDNNTLYIKF